MSINHADLAAAANIEALNYLVQTKVRAQIGPAHEAHIIGDR
jgi:hypothetical protein